jgi:hypothetical protein
VIFPGIRTRMGFFKAMGILLILVLLFVAVMIRPVRVTNEDGAITLWLWAWQRGQIDFINSVTNRPVSISFRMPWRFSRFSARTDPGTEDYYTEGLYRWNDAMAKERTRSIRYCSEVGVSVTFVKKAIRTRGGCIKADLLWPPL